MGLGLGLGLGLEPLSNVPATIRSRSMLLGCGTDEGSVPLSSGSATAIAHAECGRLPDRKDTSASLSL